MLINCTLLMRKSFAKIRRASYIGSVLVDDYVTILNDSLTHGIKILIGNIFPL